MTKFEKVAISIGWFSQGFLLLPFLGFLYRIILSIYILILNLFVFYLNFTACGCFSDGYSTGDVIGIFISLPEENRLAGDCFVIDVTFSRNSFSAAVNDVARVSLAV